MKYKPHPLAELFPPISAAEMTELRDSIKKSGLNHPITLFEGKILDGRNRYEACLLAGVQPEFQEFGGDDPVEFVISENLQRRHLSVGQRAAIALQLSSAKWGGDRTSEAYKQERNSALGRRKTADSLGVSLDSVKVYAKIDEADPSLSKKVAAGKVTLNAAEKQVKEKAKESEPPERRDGVGRVIPEGILQEWDRAAEIGKRLQACAQDIKLTIERGLDDKDVIFSELRRDTANEASSLRYTLSQILPYAVCPRCQGKLQKSCPFCRKRGWVSKFYWNSAVPDEEKAIIAKVGK